MAILLVILLALHLIGALLFIPPMVSLLRPKFAIKYADEHDRRILEEGNRKRRGSRASLIGRPAAPDPGC